MVTEKWVVYGGLIRATLLKAYRLGSVETFIGP